MLLARRTQLCTLRLCKAGARFSPAARTCALCSMASTSVVFPWSTCATCSSATVYALCLARSTAKVSGLRQRDAVIERQL